MPKVVLAVDVGTGSTRAALVDERLNILSLGAQENELTSPHPGHMEQDPEKLLKSLVAAVQECLENAPEGISPCAIVIDTAMHSLLPLDEKGNPLTPLMTWADTRAGDDARRIAREAGPPQEGDMRVSDTLADTHTGEVRAGDTRAGDARAGAACEGDVRAGDKRAGDAPAGVAQAGDVRASNAHADDVQAALDHVPADRPGVADSLYARTGCPPHASYLPGKIAWLRREEPELFARTAIFASLKSYLLHFLTQGVAGGSGGGAAYPEDLSSASGSGLLHMGLRTWDERTLAVLGIDRGRLPRLVEPTAVVGPLAESLARRWGIHPIPVIAGGADGPVANIGAGCAGPDRMAITIGTSAAVRMVVDAPAVDALGRTWCYYVADGSWMIGGAANSGGGSLKWLLDLLLHTLSPLSDPSDALARLDRAAADVPPGADGLIAGPYFSGERSPGWQADARGYFFGLGMQHRAGHMARAIMEGVAYQIAWIVEGIVENAGEPQEIRVTGGFLQSTVWPRIVADVLGRQLVVPAHHEGSLLGTAALGFSAIDRSRNWREMAASIGEQRRIDPDPGVHAQYRRHLEAYKALYASLKGHFRG